MMSDKKWIKKEIAPGDFKEEFPDYPEFFADLFWQRGLRNRKEVDSFLNPNYEKDLHNPKLLKNIEKGAKRVWQAIEKKEKIIIFGDYDADGISASIILAEFFKIVNFSHGVYMPDRNSEGYGLNMDAVEGFIKDGVNLLITLDCGITGIKEIQKAQEAGLDVIVIDHHIVVDNLPPAYAVVDQHQEGDNYPFKGLCGAGLAFKFFQVLIQNPKLKEIDPNFVEDKENKEKWLLDLVSLATVADMMPLVGENRTLVKYGLIVLAQTKRVGLLELFKVAGINPALDKETLKTNINVVSLGFSLGPRINAASRMAHATLAYNLLTTEDQAHARILALELEENNIKRKKEIEYVYKEIISNIDEENLPSFIVESSPNWSVAILGLIANRIKDKYARPVMLIDEQGETSKASLRGPDSFDLVEALKSVEDIMIHFGGHRAAAGGAFKTKDISLLKERLNIYAEKNLTDEMKTSKLEIDVEILVEDMNLENIELLEKLAPFGMANPKPIFLIREIELIEVKIMGKKSEHAKLFFKANNSSQIPALMFFHNGQVENLQIGQKYDIVGELSVNVWNGNRLAQFKIIDFKKSKN